MRQVNPCNNDGANPCLYTPRTVTEVRMHCSTGQKAEHPRPRPGVSMIPANGAVFEPRRNFIQLSGIRIAVSCARVAMSPSSKSMRRAKPMDHAVARSDTRS